MKSIIKIFLSGFFALGIFSASLAQGLPPGWDYSATPSNHIISIPLTAEPNINGYLLNPGDWIGVFYTNDDGILVCGGATEWLGDQNTGIIAFGDDAFTGDKDGFSSGEPIAYRFYSWTVEKEYEAEAECNDGLPITCDSFVSNGLSGCDSIWANGFYIVASASQDSVCAGDEIQLLVEPSEGSGNYTYNWTSEPAGFNSTIPNPFAMPVENTSYSISVDDGNEVLEMSVFVEVFPEPFADAGSDMTICEDSVATVTGEIENSSTSFWETEGDGTFSNPDLQETDYVPGAQDISNGGAVLNFTAQPVSPCTVSAADYMELNIIGLPNVDAGDNQIVCQDQPVQISATLLNAIEILWTTNGDGTFQNPTQIETVYTPGSDDILSGMINILAVAQPLAPCQTQSQDQLEISIAYLPEIVAGDDQVICETQNVTLAGTVENTVDYSWTTNGDGTFDNVSNLETIYFPGSDDMSSGEVEITLNAEAISPCLGTYADHLSVVIVAEPSGNAGVDATICETGTLQLSGMATDYDEILWSGDGDGTFDDPNSLNTNYFPGPQDLINLAVQIQLTVQPLYPCSNQAADDMLLNIIKAPQANAGEDFTIQVGEVYLAMGEAESFSSMLWTTSGDGVFEAPTNPETNYIPGDQDIDNAGAVLSLTAEPINPCVATAVDDMLLTIDTVTDVKIINPDKYISVYPNPAKGIFIIEIQAVVGETVQIYVYDNMGQEIFECAYENQAQDGISRKIVDLTGYKTGVYVVQVVLPESTVSKKILKSDIGF